MRSETSTGDNGGMYSETDVLYRQSYGVSHVTTYCMSSQLKHLPNAA